MAFHTPSRPPRNNTGTPCLRAFKVGWKYGKPVYTLGWEMGSNFVKYVDHVYTGGWIALAAELWTRDGYELPGEE